MAESSHGGQEPQGTGGGGNTGVSAERTIDEHCRRAFEAARRGSSSRPIEEFLPAADSPCYLATLEELVCIDIEFAWKKWDQGGAGNPRRANQEPVPSPEPVEGYLARFPVLRRPEMMRRLVEHERLVRAQAGFRISEDEYRRRFGDLRLAAGEIETIAQPPEAETVAPSPPPRRQIGRFMLQNELGQGAFGKVYLAYDPQLDRLVALKLAKYAFDNVEQVERFLEGETTQARAPGRLERAVRWVRRHRTVTWTVGAATVAVAATLLIALLIPRARDLAGQDDSPPAEGSPASESAVQPQLRMIKSRQNLQQIGMAFQTYQNVYRRYPSSAIFSRDGKPLLSWRVALFPYMESSRIAE